MPGFGKKKQLKLAAGLLFLTPDWQRPFQVCCSFVKFRDIQHDSLTYWPFPSPPLRSRTRESVNHTARKKPISSFGCSLTPFTWHLSSVPFRYNFKPTDHKRPSLHLPRKEKEVQRKVDGRTVPRELTCHLLFRQLVSFMGSVSVTLKQKRFIASP